MLPSAARRHCFCWLLSPPQLAAAPTYPVTATTRTTATAARPEASQRAVATRELVEGRRAAAILEPMADRAASLDRAGAAASAASRTSSVTKATRSSTSIVAVL